MKIKLLKKIRSKFTIYHNAGIWFAKYKPYGVYGMENNFRTLIYTVLYDLYGSRKSYKMITKRMWKK